MATRDHSWGPRPAFEDGLCLHAMCDFRPDSDSDLRFTARPTARTCVELSVPGVQAVERVRIRWIGHELHAEAEIISDADLTLAEAHEIAEEAHHQLLHQIRRLARATIHTSPCAHDGRDHHATTAHHYPSAVPATPCGPVAGS